MNFQWNRLKAESNLKDHQVSFKEASTAFDDPLQTAFPDDAHSEGEHRYTLLATSARGRVLAITYTERGDDIRIISAREATRREVQEYESHFFGN
ncbi:MAG: BrnT family toxin [Blastocatellia bacterium]